MKQYNIMPWDSPSWMNTIWGEPIVYQPDHYVRYCRPIQSNKPKFDVGMVYAPYTPKVLMDERE